MQKEVKHVDEDKCAQCGTPAAPGTRFCESCGAPLPAAAQPAQGSAAAASAYATPEPQVQYQGVAIRFVAFIIDGIISGIITYILVFLFTGSAITIDTSTGAVSLGPAYPAYYVALGIVIALLYFTLLLGRYGQSVGMMAVKIKVVSEANGGPITYGAAFIRTILLYIDQIPYVIPYLLGAILIWTSDKKQRLGDRAAHTVVLKA
jgi:uncharacterized RDD family membrane protein YckC